MNIHRSPYKSRQTKPERGYIIFLSNGAHVYEMVLTEEHIEWAINGAMMIIDATSMEVFSPKDGEWFKLTSLSDMIEHGRKQRIVDQHSKSKNLGVSVRKRTNKKPKKKRTT